MLKMLKSKDITNRFLTKVKDITNRFLTKVKDIACRFLTKVKDMSVHVSYPKRLLCPLTSRTTEGSDNSFNFPLTSLCQSLNSVGLMPNCFLKQAEK